MEGGAGRPSVEVPMWRLSRENEGSNTGPHRLTTRYIWMESGRRLTCVRSFRRPREGPAGDSLVGGKVRRLWVSLLLKCGANLLVAQSATLRSQLHNPTPLLYLRYDV